MKRLALLAVFIGFHFTFSGEKWRETTEDWVKFSNYLKLSKKHFDISTFKTIDFGKKAFQLAKKWNDEVNMAIAGLYIAKGYESKGDFDKAVELYFESLKVFQKDNSKIDIAYTLDAIGYLYYYFRDPKLALFYFEKALKIYSENRESPAYALVLNHIGLAAEMEGDVQRAERVYKDALKISLQNNDIPLIGTLYHNIALLNLNKEKFETAEMFYLKSEKYLKGDKESVQAAILYINFAHLYIEMKDYSLAKKYLRDAEEICRKSGAKYLLPDILFNYHLLYNNLKNREKSLTYYKEFAEAEGRLISSVKRSKMDNIRTDFLINQKNEEIKELHITKKDLNSIAARYKVLIVVLFGTIILGFVVMVFFVTKTTKEKTDRKSDVEKKRKKDKTQKYSRSVLGNKEKKEIADKIEALFIEEKIFLKKNLTLTDLSEELGISRTYTSQVINEIFGKTFTKLVNEYRIREAGTLMKSDLYKIYTIESIANEVGFNSTNVFSKAFKESYGQTPSSFLRQNC